MLSCEEMEINVFFLALKNPDKRGTPSASACFTQNSAKAGDLSANEVQCQHFAGKAR